MNEDGDRVGVARVVFESDDGTTVRLHGNATLHVENDSRASSVLPGVRVPVPISTLRIDNTTAREVNRAADAYTLGHREGFMAAKRYFTQGEGNGPRPADCVYVNPYD